LQTFVLPQATATLYKNRDSGGEAMTASQFSPRVLNIGFLAALALAAIAFIAAGFYLLRFAGTTQDVIAQMLSAGYTGGNIDQRNVELLQNGLTIHAYLARVLLVSCGMFVALAFGFLGFALFLVGASGQSDASASTGQGLQVTLTNLAPGSIAIVGATILAGICVTRYMPVEFEFGGGRSSSQREASRSLIAPQRERGSESQNKAAPGPEPGDPLAAPDPRLPK
jgi:hypothetical protein